MAWKKSSPIQRSAKEFYDNCKADDYQDKVHLAYERTFADAWVGICDHLDFYEAAKVDEFEKLLKDGVELQWGPCDVQFFRDKRKIMVFAKDGRAMELVSGEPILTDEEGI